MFLKPMTYLFYFEKEKKRKCALLMMTECSSAHEENEKEKKWGFLQTKMRFTLMVYTCM